MATQQLLKPRFEKFVRKTRSCWFWKSTLNKDGYGKFWYVGKGQVPAHRMAWFLETGYWPKPKEFICHTCDVPGCVNPKHLVIADVLFNNRDTVRKKRHHESRKTHCPKRHPYSVENTLTWKNTRKCRTCVQMRKR